MALGVPLLTFLMSPEERLEYRMGVFLLWSLTLVGLARIRRECSTHCLFDCFNSLEPFHTPLRIRYTV
ncbi:MAG: hypothetical protein AAF449_10745, partial [Myxococcota bacterium]